MIKKIRKHNCQIAILDINKSFNDLVNLSDKLNISKFKTEKRKNEILSSRLLLRKILPNTTISYNIYGAPEINTKKFISISHSQNLTAIIISDNRVGIDIEKISSKAFKVYSKFIEKNRHLPLSKEKATLIWACKEAIYKWHQKGNINFINDIKILPFIVKHKDELTAEFKNQKITLHYQKINDYFLVYVCRRKY